MRISLFFILVLSLAACQNYDQPVIRPVINATIVPSPTPEIIPPKGIPAGEPILYNKLEVTMLKTEVTGSYETEYGFRREPSSGTELLWVQVKLKNMGADAQVIPSPEHFSLLYGENEIKPSYGHRVDFPDYPTSVESLYPGAILTTWLRFDIPLSSNLQPKVFVFLPESYHYLFRPSSSVYPWANHPAFTWQCLP